MAGQMARMYIPGVGESVIEFGGGTPFAVDAVKKFPVGTVMRLGGRTYVYSHAGGTVNPEVGAYKNKKSNTNAVAPVQATGAGVEGSYTVTVTIDTHIGVLATGVLSENELTGGYIVIGNGTSQHPQFRMIMSHPALTTTGGSLTLTLDSPLESDVTAATTNIELWENPYSYLLADNSGGDYVTFVGVSTVVAASGEYFWLQTWGPCWITSDGNTCDSVRDRTIVFVGNGSVLSSNDVTVESGLQIAGVALDTSSSGSSNGPLVMLQISP